MCDVPYKALQPFPPEQEEPGKARALGDQVPAFNQELVPGSHSPRQDTFVGKITRMLESYQIHVLQQAHEERIIVRDPHQGLLCKLFVVYLVPLTFGTANRCVVTPATPGRGT